MSIISPKPIGRPSALLERVRALPVGQSLILPWKAIKTYQSNVLYSLKSAGIEATVEVVWEGDKRTLKITKG